MKKTILLTLSAYENPDLKRVKEKVIHVCGCFQYRRREFRFFLFCFVLYKIAQMYVCIEWEIERESRDRNSGVS